MDILELMQTRYTTKHFDQGRHVSAKDMEKLLEVLRLCPSSVNSQPWHFYVVTTPEGRERIRPAIKDFNVNRLTASDFIFFAVPATTSLPYWEALYEKEKADGRYKTWTSDERPDAQRMEYAKMFEENPQEWFNYASNQTFLAAGCLTVAAAEMGIDSTLLGGIDFDMLDDLLGIKAKNHRTILGIALGYRASKDSNASRPKSRWEKEDIIHHIP